MNLLDSSLIFFFFVRLLLAILRRLIYTNVKYQRPSCIVSYKFKKRQAFFQDTAPIYPNLHVSYFHKLHSTSLLAASFFFNFLYALLRHANPHTRNLSSLYHRGIARFTKIFSSIISFVDEYRKEEKFFKKFLVRR